MEKPIGYQNVNELREIIKKNINSKTDNKNTSSQIPRFVKENIIIKPIDYYYTNPIARASKIMNECRQISKKLSFTGIEKAS